MRHIRSGRKPRRSYAQSDSNEFHAEFQVLASKAQHVTLIGMGLNVLMRDPIAKLLIDRASGGVCQLDVFLADPESPAVQTRLVEEELDGQRAPVGPTGLRDRLESLLARWRGLGRPESMKIRLIRHYPTFALMMVDSDYFFYPYGFATLGNFSPVLHFCSADPADLDMIQFLNTQCSRIRAGAVDAERLLDARRGVVAAATLQAFAVYYVPPSPSELYNLGTQILGYDVRERKPLPSLHNEMVGDAVLFGFHLTVCDALYFATDSEIRAVSAEVRYLARHFRPFDLTEIKPRRHFPDATSLALTTEDRSGTLEALHCDLVQSVYRRACASNYSLRLSPVARDADFDRARLMIERYHSPYILKRFVPHFTLLTKVPERESEVVHGEVEALFESQVSDHAIRVDGLAIMLREPNGYWSIQEEVPLGK